MSKAERWLAIQPRANLQLRAADCFILGALALSAAALCAVSGTQLSFLGQIQFNDAWYGADSYRVFVNLTQRTSEHYRSSVHPLFPLLAASPVIIAVSTLDVSATTAVVVALSINGALAVALLFLVLRTFLRRLDATLFCLLLFSSAAFIFWFGTPETYAWGATSILLALLALAVIPYGRWWLLSVTVSAATLSFTVTNWMAGIVATFLSHPARKAVHITVYAFALVALLTAVQYVVYPTAGKFLYVRSEHRYVLSKPAAVMPTKLGVFWTSSMVARPPALYRLRRTTPIHATHTLLATREPRTTIGNVASAAWLALLGIAAWAFVADSRFRVLKLGAAAVIIGQCLLHLVYGSEPFLYVGHYLPVLIVAAAFACTTKARPFALSLCVVVTIAAGYNNFQQFKRSLHLISGTDAPCARDRDCHGDEAGDVTSKERE